MKKLIHAVLFAAFWVGFFSLPILGTGCSTAQIAKIPNASFDSWVHDGKYGVFTTHVEAHGATKQADGTIKIQAYTGHLNVAGGYGPSDTITNLVIEPGTPPAPLKVVPEAK